MAKEISNKKIVIVGAGIAGLSAGIYGQKNGFKTEIYEKNPVNGGLCTSWVRKDQLIDGCIHWMTGTKEGTDINKMWHDVNAFDKEDVIHSDNFGSIEYGDKVFTYWCDLNRLERDLLAISPQDKRLIKKLISYITKFYRMPLPMDKPMSTMNIFDFIKIGWKMIPYLPSFLYAKRLSQVQFANKFKSKELRYILSRVVPGDGNLYTALYAYGTAVFGNGGVLKGGSSYLVERMEKEYKDLGGIIHNNKEVSEFIIKHKTIIGMKLKNGDVVASDYYVTSCDAFEATRKLLKRKHRDNSLIKRFISKEKYPTPSCIYISYKVDAQALKELNITNTYEFPCEPFNVGNRKEDSVKIRNYLYDQTFIKDGHVLLNVLIHQNDNDFYYWENIRKDYPTYKKVKDNVAEQVKTRIETRFPSLKGKIESIDVATPMTYNRYVNAHRGAYMPWAFTAKGNQLLHNSSVSGLKNLLFSGQWTIMPGGLPIALMSGKFAIQLILKKEHRKVALNK